MPHASTLAAILSTACVLTGQNEIVFAGTSAGSLAPHFFTASATGNVAASAAHNLSSSVTDAVWMDAGTNLYCARFLSATGDFLTRAQWNGTSATWSAFFTGPGPCYGLGADRVRKRLWTLTGATATTRELVCLDVDQASAGYGQVIAQTSTLSGSSRERWELSPSGNIAVVPHAFLHGTGRVQIVDTNPSSPTFATVIQSAPVAAAAASLVSGVFGCAVSGDDLFAYVVYGGLPVQGLAVLFIPTGTWLDFDALAPGQQDLPLPTVPGRLAMAPYGHSVVITSGNGVARVDVDPWVPQNTTVTMFTSAGPLTGSNAPSLSADGRRLAVTVTVPVRLLLFDMQSGGLLHSLLLPVASDMNTTAWQDLRPDASFTSYGSGCGGSLGLPTLTAMAPPRLGSTFSMTANHAPGSVAVFVAGSSDTLYGSLVLPYSLTSHGAPACALLTDPGITMIRTGSANSATWSFFLPSSPVHIGSVFFSQAFTLDPQANLLGMGSTHGGRGMAGL